MNNNELLVKKVERAEKELVELKKELEKVKDNSITISKEGCTRTTGRVNGNLVIEIYEDLNERQINLYSDTDGKWVDSSGHMVDGCLTYTPH